MSEAKRGDFFVMILLPCGPKPLVDGSRCEDDPQVCFFTTRNQARTAAMANRAVMAYGAEIHELGCGVEDVP